MRPAVLFSLLVAGQAALATVPPAGTSFVGRLEKRLVAETTAIELVILKPLAAAEAPIPLAAGERAFQGTTLPWPGAEPLPLILLVSAEDREVALLYDRDRDGKIAPDERTAFPAAPDNSLSLVEIRLPLPSGPFPDYPLYVWPFQGKVSGLQVPEGSYLLTRSKNAYAYGKVEVEGRPVAVRYAVSPGQPLDPRTGEQGLDVDGDGSIGGRSTPETDVGDGKAGPVFPVGSLYLSTRSLDGESGRIEMVAHPASDFRRVVVAAGAQMPDFSFSDYAGRAHKLSDLRGKYVLLDFWATWCAPCLAELPHLKEMYSSYRERGLEIVTVAWRDDAEKAAKRVEQEGLPWLQGTAESTEKLATEQLRLESIPFTLLLDRQGTIVAIGLRGEALRATLAELLPEI